MTTKQGESMNEQAVTTTNGNISAETLEKVLIGGDLKDLTPAQRVEYYQKVCDSLRLNPLTKPFDYIILNSKLTLYAKRDATDQLRERDSVSINITAREMKDEVYIVTAKATLPNGREDESTGVVAIANLKGDALANALMKAETKAKRRVTLSICGLGWLDETEIETVPQARIVPVDTETGEIPQIAPQPQPKDAQFRHPVRDFNTVKGLAMKYKLWQPWLKEREEAHLPWKFDEYSSVAEIMDAGKSLSGRVRQYLAEQKKENEQGPLEEPDEEATS